MNNDANAQAGQSINWKHFQEIREDPLLPFNIIDGIEFGNIRIEVNSSAKGTWSFDYMREDFRCHFFAWSMRGREPQLGKSPVSPLGPTCEVYIDALSRGLTETELIKLKSEIADAIKHFHLIPASIPPYPDQIFFAQKDAEILRLRSRC